MNIRERYKHGSFLNMLRPQQGLDTDSLFKDGTGNMREMSSPIRFEVVRSNPSNMDTLCQAGPPCNSDACSFEGN